MMSATTDQSICLATSGASEDDRRHSGGGTRGQNGRHVEYNSSAHRHVKRDGRNPASRATVQQLSSE